MQYPLTFITPLIFQNRILKLYYILYHMLHQVKSSPRSILCMKNFIIHNYESVFSHSVTTERVAQSYVFEMTMSSLKLPRPGSVFCVID